MPVTAVLEQAPCATSLSALHYEDQKEWLALISCYLHSSPVMDRDYFRSIYFCEPGGVLFELATDIPGFAIDEPIETVGESLGIPDWLEPHRAEMMRHLPSKRRIMLQAWEGSFPQERQAR